MKRIVPLLLVAAVLGCSLHAMDAKHYQALSKKLKTDEKSAHLFFGYFTGLGEGLALANGSLMLAGKPSLFCVPPDLSLNPDNLADLIDKGLSDLAGLKKLPQLKGTT